jgi:hypothetical protein
MTNPSPVVAPSAPQNTVLLLQQYTAEWKKADAAARIPGNAGMAFRSDAPGRKLYLRQQVAALGVDPEAWERPLRSASNMTGVFITSVIVIGFIGFLLWAKFGK